MSGHGFPVLFYIPSTPTSLWHCNLLFKYSDKSKQATLCLQFSLFLNTSDDEHSVIFRIDADNVNGHNSSIQPPAGIALTTERLGYIRRRSDRINTRTLFLSLLNPCPTWCPKPWQFTSPALTANTYFRQLVEFANVTELHIVFDYNWLHAQTQRPSLDRFLAGEEYKTGFHVADRYPDHRLADLKLFSVDDTAGPLPSYAEATEAPEDADDTDDADDTEHTQITEDIEATDDTATTKKRPRAGTLHTSSPPRKRAVPNESPTVSASSTGDSSPEPTLHNPKEDDLEEGELQEGEIQEGESEEGEIQKGELHKGELHKGKLHKGELHKGESQRVAIERAVIKHLPSILAKFFAVPPTGLNLSSQPRQTLPKLTLEQDRLLMLLQPTLTAVYEHAISLAEDVRSNMDDVLDETWEDRKWEASSIKDEYLQEMQQAKDDLFLDIDEMLKDMLKQKEVDLEQWFDDAGEAKFFAVEARLDDLAETCRRKFKRTIARECREACAKAIRKATAAGEGRETRSKAIRGGRQRGKGGYRNLGTRWKTEVG